MQQPPTPAAPAAATQPRAAARRRVAKRVTTTTTTTTITSSHRVRFQPPPKAAASAAAAAAPSRFTRARPRVPRGGSAPGVPDGLPSGIIPGSELASATSSTVRALARHRVGQAKGALYPAARGWCFPAVFLTASDEERLFDLHCQFKIKHPQVWLSPSQANRNHTHSRPCPFLQTLVSSCLCVRHLILQDFPAEIVLQVNPPPTASSAYRRAHTPTPCSIQACCTTSSPRCRCHAPHLETATHTARSTLPTLCSAPPWPRCATS